MVEEEEVVEVVQLAEEEREENLMEGRNWVEPTDVSKDSCVCSSSSQVDIACNTARIYLCY